MPGECCNPGALPKERCSDCPMTTREAKQKVAAAPKKPEAAKPQPAKQKPLWKTLLDDLR